MVLQVDWAQLQGSSAPHSEAAVSYVLDKNIQMVSYF